MKIIAEKSAPTNKHQNYDYRPSSSFYKITSTSKKELHRKHN